MIRDGDLDLVISLYRRSIVMAHFVKKTSSKDGKGNPIFDTPIKIGDACGMFPILPYDGGGRLRGFRSWWLEYGQLRKIWDIQGQKDCTIAIRAN